MDKPLPWKEFRKLVKEKKVHTVEKRIEKFGILFVMDDINDLAVEITKDLKKILKKMFDNFLEEFEFDQHEHNR